MNLSATRSRRFQLIVGLAGGLALGALSAQADQQVEQGQAEQGGEAAVTECLGELGLEVVSATPSPIAGLFEVEVQDGAYLYVQGGDCRHLIAGDLYERRGEQLIGLTRAKRTAKQRARLKKAMAQVADDDPIVFAPSDRRAAIWVFTDPDCGYCRKMHAQMSDYHALGIEVRYLAFPRAGVNSLTYDKMVSAWCAEDPRAALTALKSGERIPSRSCPNPVAKQHAIAQEVGLSGTPAIVLEDGTVLPGFVPADALATRLGL